MANKTQRNKNSKGKKKGEFKKSKRLSQIIRKGISYATDTVAEQIAEAKNS